VEGAGVSFRLDGESAGGMGGSDAQGDACDRESTLNPLPFFCIKISVKLNKRKNLFTLFLTKKYTCKRFFMVMDCSSTLWISTP
jgi:hypothetical protein